MLEKTLESHLDHREIKPVNPKGNQSLIFIGMTEAEAPVLWPRDAKNWCSKKDPDAGKDWGQEEKGATKDKMVGRHHWLNGHGFEQTLGDTEGQGKDWRAAVHEVTKSWTQLSDWTELRQEKSGNFFSAIIPAMFISISVIGNHEESLRETS